MSTIIKVSNMYGTTLSPDGVETVEIHLTPTLGLDTQIIQDAVDDAEASAAAALASENAAAASEAAALASENAAATSETNAANSEAAALASENAAAASESAAATSETNAAASEAAALASENAAAASETNASDSEAAALVSQNAAAASESAAATSETNAANSETAAANSETAAAASQAAALVSQNAAAASESAAAASESNALDSENAAATSETNALASENAAASSESNASTSASQALASKNAAATSETNAANSAAAALASQNAAATSETNASDSEAAALASKNAAAASETAAAASEAAAALSETNAASSEAAAAQSASDAADSATAAAASLRPRGDWDASTGNFPAPTLVPDERADFYQISVAGIMSDANPSQPDVDASVGDQLYWHLDNDIWYLIDNTDQVTSVDGQKGIVVVDKYTQAQIDSQMAGKSNTGHGHTISQVSGLQAALDGKVDDSQVLTDVPAGAVFTDTNTWRGVDNTPVDGQTAESISSNWAYDHAASSTAHPRDSRNLATSANAVSASKWQTSRTLTTTLTGDVTGTANMVIDGSANKTVTVNATVVNDSHTHDGRYYTEAEADARFVNVTGDNMTGDLTITKSAGKIKVSSTANTDATLELLEADELHGAIFRYEGDLNDWQLLRRNSGVDSVVMSGTRESNTVTFTGALYSNTSNRVFAQDYHPNADKWTTARTITFTGGVTGSVSIDGSVNKSVSMSVAQGSGSGLDADTVDSLHASQFIRSDTADNVNGRTKWINTTSVKLPAGSTAQRTSSPEVGDIRFNSSEDGFEGYNSRGWGSIGGGGIPEYTIKTSGDTYNLDIGEGLLVQTSGIAGPVTVTLPSTGVEVGDWFSVGQLNEADDPIILAYGSIPIMGLNEDFHIDTDYQVLTFSYVSSAFGWKIVNAVGESEAPRAIKTVVDGVFTAGTHTFNIGYDEGYIDVFIGGFKLATTEFVATNGTTVQLVDSAGNPKPLLNDSYVYLQAWNHVQQEIVTADMVGQTDSTDNPLTTPATNVQAKLDMLDTLIREYSNPNLLINGDCLFNQRGVASYTASGYSLDRWNTVPLGGSVAQLTEIPTVGESATKMYMNTLVSGAYIEQQVEFGHRILADSSATFSAICAFTVGSPANFDLHVVNHDKDAFLLSNIPLEIEQISGSSYYKISATFDVPSLPDTFRTNLGIRLAITGNVDGWITDLKLESGTTATPFVADLPADSLAKCQRYYWRRTALVFMGAWLDATADWRNVYIPFPVTMRANPAVSYSTTDVTISDTRLGATGVSLVGHATSNASGASLSNFAADAEL